MTYTFIPPYLQYHILETSLQHMNKYVVLSLPRAELLNAQMYTVYTESDQVTGTVALQT
jgi:hypothetical protein